nr:type IV secretion system protein [Donghicola eburneus]
MMQKRFHETFKHKWGQNPVRPKVEAGNLASTGHENALRLALGGLMVLLPCAASALGHAPFVPSVPEVASTGNEVSGESADGLIRSLKAVLTGVIDEIASITRGAILTFFAINIIVSLGRSTIGNTPFAEFLQKLGYSVIMAVFLLGIVTIIPDIVGWLLQFSGVLNQAAAQGAGLSSTGAGTAAEPSVGNILQNGLSGLASMLDSIDLLSPATFLFVFIALVATVLLGVTIVVFVVAYGELYFVAVLGMIVLGLGVFEPTKDLVKTYFMTLLGSTLALVTILLTYAIITGASSAAFGQAGGWDGGLTEVLASLLLQVVGVFLILMLPRTIQGLVGSGGSTALGPLLGAAVAGGIAKASAATLGAAGGGLGGLASGGVSAAGGSAGEIATSALASAGKGAKTYAGAGWSRPVTGLAQQAASDLRGKFGKAKNE